MLKEQVEYFSQNGIANNEDFFEFAKNFTNKLETGEIRSAWRDTDGTWKVNTWVKTGIHLLFQYGTMKDYSIDANFKFFDKNTLGPREMKLEDNIRLIPGGSAIRCGVFIGERVICVPPMYINIGAYVDSGSMIDSHALIGTCAQIGKNVHISAAAQIGGVLEPAGARPVIIEDDVMVGGNCGVYEGVLVRQGAVLGTGVIMNASTHIYDLVNERVIKSNGDIPLEVPEKAVVIPGSRALNTEFAKSFGLSISTPIIIKYRDEKTNIKTALNDLLR
ncbi:MAG: 2,3,4,5-tetrahydropyridine-2,6-dicarboxylate N-succinyltransferase [bacterium]